MLNGVFALARSGRRRISLELRLCREELTRLRCLPHPPISVLAAVCWSTAVVGFGNGVVVAGRATGRNDLITLAAVPAAGAVGALALGRRGWPSRSLGIHPLAADRPVGLPWAVVGAAALVVIAKGLYLVVTGDSAQRLAVVRLVIGTAAGEELVHRGTVLTLWSATRLESWAVVLANVTAFGLWHVAGAFRGGDFVWWEVAGPAVLTLVLLWARMRFRSLAAAAIMHAAGNLLFTSGKS